MGTALPPPTPLMMIMTMMDNRGEVPDQAAAPSRGQQGAGVLHPSYTLLPWAAGTTTTRTGLPAACRPPATGLLRRQRCTGCWRHRGRRGGGGGEEACRTPGGVRSTMIKAGRDREGWTRLQRGQEEEESGSVGGQDRDGVPGAGSELGRGGQWRRPGTGQPLGGCHPVAFQRGQGVSSPAPRQLSRTRGRRWLRPWGLVAE